MTEHGTEMGLEDVSRACTQMNLEEGLEVISQALSTPAFDQLVLRFYSNDDGSGDHSNHSDSGAGGPGASQAGVKLPTGDASTLLMLMASTQPDIQGSLLKVMELVRAALRCVRVSSAAPFDRAAVEGAGSGGQSLEEASIGTAVTPPAIHPVMTAVARLPAEVMSRLVSLAVRGSDSSTASEGSLLGTGNLPQCTLDVLRLVLGCPYLGVGGNGSEGSGAQPKLCAEGWSPSGLHDHVLDQLLQMVGSWAGAGPVALEHGSVADLALWLASRQKRLPALVSALVGLARGVAERLAGQESSGLGQGTTTNHEVMLLARCLEIIEAVLGQALELLQGPGGVCDEDEAAALLPGAGLEWIFPWSHSDGYGTRCGGSGRKAPDGGNVVDKRHAVGSSSLSRVRRRKAPEPPRACTFVATHKKFVDQHWYHCYTCGLVQERGCCSLCVRVCHRGHTVTYARRSCFFCDCGGTAEGSPLHSLEASPASSSAGRGGG
ncbi:unnamed protein product, partial [Discosporangium mesarthrocarpum]